MDNFDPYHFIFEQPLYTRTTVYEKTTHEDRVIVNNSQAFIDLATYRGQIEAYNPILKQQTTYNVVSNLCSNIAQQFQKDVNAYYNDVREIKVECVRNRYSIRVFVEIITWYYDSDDDEVSVMEIRKIGQTPSIADIHISRIKQYDKILSKSKLTEFTRAIGLAAAGVGIGAFVYLRRIFETLIYEARDIARQEDSWDEERFSKERMAEKITLLKNHLPTFLVENKSMYSILSKGIHELEENECKKYFEAVKLGIELILDERLEQLDKKQRLENAAKKLQEISKNLGGTS